MIEIKVGQVGRDESPRFARGEEREADWNTRPPKPLDAAPGELTTLVEQIAGKLLDAEEVAAFTRETLTWTERNRGARYAWSGDFRELEQCVRHLVLRGEYRPTGPLVREGGDDGNAVIESGSLTAEELRRRYTRIVFTQAGTIAETAQRLDLDRRTVKARLT